MTRTIVRMMATVNSAMKMLRMAGEMLREALWAPSRTLTTRKAP